MEDLHRTLFASEIYSNRLFFLRKKITVIAKIIFNICLVGEDRMGDRVPEECASLLGLP